MSRLIGPIGSAIHPPGGVTVILNMSDPSPSLVNVWVNDTSRPGTALFTVGCVAVLKVKAGTYLIEGANPRHEHEWRVWESVKLPAGKVLAPGVISHATNVVEHPELVAERLVRIGKLIGPENLMAGTDCGFAQGPFHRRVHPSIMWAKLESLATGARLASRQLF